MIWGVLLQVAVAFFAVIGFFEMMHQIFLLCSKKAHAGRFIFVLHVPADALAETDLFLRRFYATASPEIAAAELLLVPESDDPLCLETCHVLASMFENVRVSACGACLFSAKEKQHSSSPPNR